MRHACSAQEGRTAACIRQPHSARRLARAKSGRAVGCGNGQEDPRGHCQTRCSEERCVYVLQQCFSVCSPISLHCFEELAQGASSSSGSSATTTAVETALSPEADDVA